MTRKRFPIKTKTPHGRGTTEKKKLQSLSLEENKNGGLTTQSFVKKITRVDAN